MSDILVYFINLNIYSGYYSRSEEILFMKTGFLYGYLI